MKATSLRKWMMGIFAFSVVGFIFFSYWQQGKPRPGGLINTIMQPAETSEDATEHYASGAKKAEGLLVNGKKEGVWVFYYENGDTQRVAAYYDDELDEVMFDNSAAIQK